MIKSKSLIEETKYKDLVIVTAAAVFSFLDLAG